MIPDIAATAVERTEAAENLFAQANSSSFAELVTLSALELCVLGGPKHAMFEEDITRAWLQMSDRQREKAKKLATEGMVKRRLLAENAPSSPDGKDNTYSLSPALGIALAARCRPAFVVLTETPQPSLRTPRFFAAGDQDEPVRGIVVEEPAALPAGSGDYPNLKKLGPLGRFYRYVLVSRARAAEVLAEWAIAPPPQSPGPDAASCRSVSLYRYAGSTGQDGIRLMVRGDGTSAQLLAPGADHGGSAPIEHDLAGLQQVMADLLTAQP